MQKVEENGVLYHVDNQKAVVAWISPNIHSLYGPELSIPAYIKNKPVKKIASRAGYGLKIKHLRIPDTIHMIHKSAFENCAELETVESYKSRLVNSVRSEWIIISDKAFKDCRMLVDVDMTQEVSYIGIESFSGCFNMTRFQATIKKIRKDAFKNCAFLRHLILSENAYLYGGSIEKSGIKLINVWGNLSTTQSVINHLRRNNIELCCVPDSNAVELAYSGINITSLF